MCRDSGVIFWGIWVVRGCGESWGLGGENECGMLNEELGLKEGRKEG